jgi:ribonuclease inhibitor
MNTLVLDGSLVSSVDNFHVRLAALLEFPDYYGKNLDALWDCLSEYVISLNGKAVQLVIKKSDHVRDVLGKEYFEKVLSCFEDIKTDSDQKFTLFLE